MKNVVALFDRHEDASNAVQELLRSGFERENISLIANNTTMTGGQMGGTGTDTPADGAATGAGVGAVLGGLGGLLVGLGVLAIPGIGPVLAAGPLMAALAGAGIGAVAGGLLGALVDLGIPEADADVYAESIRRGGTLLVVHVTDERADQAAGILNRFNPVDMQERGEHYRKADWQGFDESSEPYDAGQIDQWRATNTMGDTGQSYNRSDVMNPGQVHDMDDMRDANRSRTTDEMSVPIIDEEMQVGKRQVPKERMRVHTYLTEEHVAKDINLRHEHVNVERRPVDRPASDDMLDTFQEGTIEIEQVDEEPVVQKQARITEEVYINKEVEEEQRTIRGTERHTHVDVNKIDPKDMQTFDSDFRKHFDTTYSQTGREYNQFRDAYFYGYQKGRDQRYQSYTWDQAQQAIRLEWERESPQMRWDEYREAIGEGYRRSQFG